MSLRTEIAALSGTISSDADATVFVRDEANMLLTTIDEDALRHYASVATVTANPWPARDVRVFEVSRGGRRAYEASIENVELLGDTSSQHHARARSPRYYFNATGTGRELNCLPVPDSVAPLRIAYVSTNPAVDLDEDSVANMPSDYRHLLVLGVCRRITQARVDARSRDDDSEMAQADLQLAQSLTALYAEEWQRRLPRSTNQTDNVLRSPE